ncbi:MAG TPA: hypothetical protein DEP84_15650 [Chloroflexi bacterium]|nr:hypothetical protein [Chloroflexota bacterium]
MLTFTQVGLIDAPIEKVFAVVSDFSKIPQWRKDVPGITQISGTTAIGTTFLEEVHFMGKKQLLMKVIDFGPNQKLVIEAQQGMNLLPTQSFIFSTEGNKTRIDLTVVMRVSGLFKLMQFMLPVQLKKIWTEYFINLNNLVSK